MSYLPTTFKAFEFEEFGDAVEVLKLNPLAVHKPLQPTEVCVKVYSAAVNPIDYSLLKYGKSFVGKSPSRENPFRSGFDMAGVIVAIGVGNVHGFKVGDKVFGMPDVANTGSFAEYANVDVKFLAPKPTNMSFNDAAGVPTVGETSYQSLVDYGKLKAGQRVLILGGGSSCGMFAIQIAKAIGAEVITTCSSRNTELVKSLGADNIIDYTQEKWGDVLLKHSVDFIFDCAMEPDSWNFEVQKILKPRTGIFVTLAGARGTSSPIESPIGASRFCIFARSRSSYLESLTQLIEAGKLKTVINSVYPLDKLKDAIKEQMACRVQGKIIIEINLARHVQFWKRYTDEGCIEKMVFGIPYSRLAVGATATLALALSSSVGLVHAEELCSIAPNSYNGAKTDHPEFATAIEALEKHAIASWFTDRLSTDERSTMMSSLLSECSEDTRLSIVVYGIPNKDCDAGYSSGGSVKSTSDYQAFLKELTDAVGDRKVLYVVEPDAVGLLTKEGSCGSAAGYLDNLKIAVEALSANANAKLYVDVGYWMLADSTSASLVAPVLKELGSCGKVKGVTINTSNYRSNEEVASYCSNFQTAMGSNDMTCIVDTSRNYNGSPTSDWCNVATAGVGKPPTSETGISNLDYFMWIKPPGESDGECTSGSLTGTAAGTFFPEGFKLLWDKGYFVSEGGMATIDGNTDQNQNQNQNGIVLASMPALYEDETR
ncbi:hypothetical protein BBO99_00008824 [Phytophthora kernoviae]|uniref:Enoyl reductase (ER) domain-containing protein n=2 Tax=Phytophthora kernoviae TaxID=325452 RepID=A0A421EV70_9STRA|nr:hypothetical protein G195_010954 [Phytophthora kernoviae 00238/432]KAG2506209.1 hypothetical protein JM16_009164 [Phytophthora kernoviae]KAG2508599.1 hypothetical protein JM18_009153 [Phytophthora kernoviae]RLN02901.1 hypothetical protein BBI17_009126 [Phytophthora kernoviae]RLN74645.1 hypothetical protein BBO99_00008824 [Phytophthora kernoviae]